MQMLRHQCPNGQNSDRGIETMNEEFAGDISRLVPMDRIPTEELKLFYSFPRPAACEVPMDRIPTEELKHLVPIKSPILEHSVPMDRIPTEELKHSTGAPRAARCSGPNGQNSDRGIETLANSKSRSRPVTRSQWTEVRPRN